MECLIDSAQVRSLFGQAAVQAVCDGAMSPAPGLREIRALYGLLTLELLLSKLPNLTKEIVLREEGSPSILLT